MAIELVPDWMAELEEEDVTFIKKFLLSSGSLKEMARQYGVSYPTVRLRLDRLIQKIQISEHTEGDPYIALIKRLAVEEKLDFGTAKILIAAYKSARSGESAPAQGDKTKEDLP
ncbi:MAG: DUF2089 domain-containing protein [Clostridiales bacterium]|nr:DUF2089 domain-containing protein [Clostridiales bacterium]